MKARSGFLIPASRIASVLLLVHIIEVRVLQGHLRRDPPRRLVLEHFLQWHSNQVELECNHHSVTPPSISWFSTDPKQVVAVFVETGDKSGQLRGLPLRVLVPVRQLADAWPHLLIRGAKQPAIQKSKTDHRQYSNTHQ